MLKRKRHPMPDDIARKLAAKGLEAAYAERPAYQRNDYLGWIAQARQDATREKRIAQMLTELERGDVYMKMAWRGR